MKTRVGTGVISIIPIKKTEYHILLFRLVSVEPSHVQSQVRITVSSTQLSRKLAWYKNDSKFLDNYKYVFGKLQLVYIRDGAANLVAMRCLFMSLLCRSVSEAKQSLLWS